MPAVRRNPALVIFGNPAGEHSERSAWADVMAYAEELAANSAYELPVLEISSALRVLAQRMQRQLQRGVHVNPGRGQRTKIGDHVQAVLYVHTKDHNPYAHGFGNADIGLDTIREGDVKLSGLHDTTDVEMFGEPDGTVTLQGRNGQRLWDMHEV